MRIASLIPASIVVVLLGACSQPPAPSPSGSTTTTVAAAPVQALAPVGAGAPAARAHKSDDEEMDDSLVIPTEKFADPQKAFAEAKEALLTRYYAAGLTEEDAYRAAVQGMLSNVDPKMHKWNRLLSPSEYAQLTNDLKGEVVGIGVRVKFDEATGHIAVQAIIPGSPAEKAGIQVTDTILSVNGKLFKGKSMREAVGEIRGKAGDQVALSVLRDDKIFAMTLTRANVVLDDVTHQIVDGVGYVAVHMFSAKTVPALKSALDDFAAAKVRAMLLDVRMNQGGSFDDAVHCAELFLPAGATIVTLEKREGKKETMVAKGSPALASLPLLVLVDHGTSSGAELLTAALAEGRHARTIGARTYGKWTVQVVDPLSNGYAIKYTSAIFHAPSGKTYDGIGIAPDVEVDADKDAVERAFSIADPAARAAADPQLRTALALLRQ